ncbi:hypothetical protein Bca52824_016915 [Brassica carinata]|uniref:Uncharacterized protein n=1 Tax=Brassica carinata TaxID=52824 RepID=A0A8X8AWV7_BRACI|nr:hypothetical protein Bca52824_016915 [Brassica carinata]
MRQIVESLNVQSHLIKGLWALSSMVMLSVMAEPEQSSPLMFQSLLGAWIFQAVNMEFKASAVVLCKTTTAHFSVFNHKQTDRLKVVTSVRLTNYINRASSGSVVAPVRF